MRLELGIGTDIVNSATFQFHKGAIRTDKTHRHMFTTNLFQFHKGAIRTSLLSSSVSSCLDNFNSIKVRLEQIIIIMLHISHTLFQFHKGAIRTTMKNTSLFASFISIP
mgnify:CR=1 FL=1